MSTRKKDFTVWIKPAFFVVAMLCAESCSSLSELSQTKYRITTTLPSERQCKIGDDAIALVALIQERVTPLGFTRIKDILVSGQQWVAFNFGRGLFPEERVTVTVIEQQRLIGIADFKATSETSFVRQLRMQIEAAVLEHCDAATLHWEHITSWDPS
jgi:hypothetical protein